MGVVISELQPAAPGRYGAYGGGYGVYPPYGGGAMPPYLGRGNSPNRSSSERQAPAREGGHKRTMRFFPYSYPYPFEFQMTFANVSQIAGDPNAK